MRILHFIEGLGNGGKERQLVELLKGLREDKDLQTALVTLGEGDYHQPRIAALGIRLHCCRRRLRWDPGVCLRLDRILRDFRPHIVHTHDWMTSFYALPLCRLRRVVLVNGSIRNAFTAGGLRWRLERSLLRLSDLRVANSRAGLRSRGFCGDEERNVVIRNGFDFTRLQGLTEGPPAWLADRAAGRKTVGMVASFSPYKDYATFLTAAQEVCSRREDVVFVAIGDGDTRQSLQSTLGSRFRDRILFAGRRREVERWVRCFDIGVLATFTEGISNAIMEYMALGKPVVATNGGGTCELVGDGKTGFLVPPRSPSAMSEKIEFLLDHPETACRMGKAGQRRLHRGFSLQRLVEETRNLYQRAVSKPASGLKADRGAKARQLQKA